MGTSHYEHERWADAVSESERPLRPGEGAMTVEQVFDTAPLEPGARFITILATVISLGIPVLMVASRAPAFVIGLGCALLVLLLYSFAASPTGFALGSGQLAVTRRVLRPQLFPLASLSAARPTAMPRSWRLWGNGGAFGFWGTFRSRDWGTFKVYGTDHRKGVLLEWPGFKLFVTPSDREGFCAAALARSNRGRS
jgi:hypothetical protein